MRTTWSIGLRLDYLPRGDLEQTFFPMAKMTTMKTIIALALVNGWHLHQMDMKNTFLQG